jgi:hypothetical protein
MKFMVHPPLTATVAQLSWLKWTEREARVREISTRKYCGRENSQMKLLLRIFMDFIKGNRSDGIYCVQYLLLEAEVIGYCG